jgi:hypothetical protein
VTATGPQANAGSDAPHSIEDLLRVEARLDRSFLACVVSLILMFVWPLYIQRVGRGAIPWAGLLQGALMAATVLAYLWFIYASGMAASRLGKRSVLYVAWFLVAPCASTLPIPVVSHLIVASPLIIKLLLARDLRAEIQERTFGE